MRQYRPATDHYAFSRNGETSGRGLQTDVERYARSDRGYSGRRTRDRIEQGEADDVFAEYEESSGDSDAS